MKTIKITICLLCFSPTYLIASPLGGDIISGDASITNSNSITTINQTSHNATINWQSFNVGENEQVNFIQPNNRSTTLNNIFDQNPSAILGSINANGRVFLSNPNGFIFSATSTINTASFIASSSSVENYDEQQVTLSNKGTGSITNLGRITSADGGFIALFSPEINNAGVIESPNGEIAISNSTQGTIYLNDMAGIGIQVDSLEALNPIGINNSGEISASGGLILLDSKAIDTSLNSAINNSGLINASSIHEDGGIIRLSASSGSIEQTGIIESNAKVEGDGGDIRLIAERNLLSSGVLSAKSGSQSGDGGYIETSGRESININTQVYTTSENGLSGHWLIDPDNITIGDEAGADFTSADIISSLNTNGFLTIQADLQLDVNGGLNTSSQTGELTLLAPTININSTITGNDISLSLGTSSDTSNSINIFADINTNGLQVHSTSTLLGANINSSGEVLFSSNQILTIDGERNIEVTGSNKLSLNTVEILSNNSNASNNTDQLTLNTSNGILDLRNMSMNSLNRLNSLVINRNTIDNGSNGDINISGDIYADVFSILNGNSTLGSEQLIQLATDTSIFSDISTTFTNNKVNGNSSNLAITGKDITLDIIDDISSLVIKESEALASSDSSSVNLTGNISTKGDGIEITLSQGDIILSKDISLSTANTGHLLLNADLTSSANNNLQLSVSDSDLQIQNVTTIGNLNIANASSLTLINGDIDISGVFSTGNTPSITLSGERSISAASGIDLSMTNLISDTNTANNILLTSTGSATNISIADITTDSLSVVSSELILFGDITTSLTEANSLDFSNAGMITLANDSALTGNLNLNNSSTIVPINSQSASNSRNLIIEYGSQDFTLGLVGTDTALQSISISGTGNLILDTASTADGTLPIPVTDGSTGISLLGNLSMNLDQDLIIDTSLTNGDINLSGLSIDGAVNISLNSGSGNISLGSLGQTTAISGISTLTSGIINLYSDINNAGLTFDFSNATSIILHDDVTFGSAELPLTSTNFGTSTIDGNYDLTLYTNDLSWGAIGQDIPLQNINIHSEEMSLNITDNINLAGDLNFNLGSIIASADITTTGGNLAITALNEITLSSTSVLTSSDGNINLISSLGNIGLGSLSALNEISILASVGKIENSINDYQSDSDTSINLTSATINLKSGSTIGSSVTRPVVIKAGTGNISLNASGNIYIANLDNSSVSSNKDILDNTAQSLVALNDSLQQLNRFDYHNDRFEHQDVSDPAWQKDQDEEVMNVSAPRIYYNSKGWRLGNP